MINIGIIGNGFVGNATSIFECFENKVFIYDIEPEKCKPKELKLIDLIICDIIFICVPTPMNKDGSCNIDIVNLIVNELNSIIDPEKTLIVIRSTVPIGTSYKLKCYFMPEFLTEKKYIEDFKSCTNWVFGFIEGNDNNLFKTTITKLINSAHKYNKIQHNHITFENTDVCETIKYVRNTFLATKVSFANEFYNFCKKKKIDYNIVKNLAFSDKRIGLSHTDVPGPDNKYGYGGTCFPKDVNSMIYQMKEVNTEPIILGSVNKRNITLDRSEKDWEKDKGRAIV